MRFFKMDNSTKRLFEVVIDDFDEVLSTKFGGPSLVMVQRLATKKGEEIYIFDYFYVLFSS